MKVVREVNLRSDTFTKPTLEMRQAMFDAIVGDDGYEEDPTVRELEEMAARIFGKESCRFFPTGVMGNLASVMSHAWERGSEVILGDLSHIHTSEQGGISTVANLHTRTVRNLPDGTFSLQELKDKIRPPVDVNRTVPRTSLICLENTHNKCSGAVLPLNFIDEVTRIARGNNIPVHVDGARIFNASVAQGVSVDRILKDCNSVSVCLSKGLGCPLGNLVAGSRDFVLKAIKCRKVLGGSMRQAGVIAATGIVALNSMIDRLADDHEHARIIAEAVSSCKSHVVTVDLNNIQTNIVNLRIDPEFGSATDFCQRMYQVSEQEKEDLQTDEIVKVKVNPSDEFVRFVTHADVSREDIQLTVKKIKYVIGELDKKHIR